MFGQGKQTRIDPKKLPVFVHDVRNSEVHALVQKVWDINARAIVEDKVNKKDLLRFVFSNPTCIVWLQRDSGRTDASELVLLWDDQSSQQITEVYVLSDSQPQALGDSTRAAQLLNSILSAPSVVPSVQT